MGPDRFFCRLISRILDDSAGPAMTPSCERRANTVSRSSVSVAYSGPRASRILRAGRQAATRDPNPAPVMSTRLSRAIVHRRRFRSLQWYRMTPDSGTELGGWANACPRVPRSKAENPVAEVVPGGIAQGGRRGTKVLESVVAVGRRWSIHDSIFSRSTPIFTSQPSFDVSLPTNVSGFGPAVCPAQSGSASRATLPILLINGYLRIRRRS